ncbi:uncharacterized protein LOC109801772 [Cajanus cajan]|uniref:uncharacterized protein LOC109801772 n=1 Tax=Cajanus cajan TaxID=3821 RepID=UPI00098DB357|nr:uncharacterized protein LOC109801772 [Cajanus cajan]
MDVEDRLSSTKPRHFEKTAPTMIGPNKPRELPLRLYYGNGQRIHAQKCIEYGVVDRLCEECGQVGQLTCFSSSFRKWALSRVTREEMYYFCGRCMLYGHKTPDCDLLGIPPIWHDPTPKERKAVHCGLCGKPGHNRRTCLKVGRN